jgi:hypothetical protein
MKINMPPDQAMLPAGQIFWLLKLNNIQSQQTKLLFYFYKVNNSEYSHNKTYYYCKDLKFQQTKFFEKLNITFFNIRNLAANSCNSRARGEVHLNLIPTPRPKLILFSYFVSSGRLQLEGL